MTHHDVPVTEDELHAYVDGELPADRKQAVAAWLEANPQDADRVAAWRAQADAIRARYGAVAVEPVPDRFRIERLTREQRFTRWVAAAAVAAFMIGGASGWIARGASSAAPNGIERFTAEAIEAHRLYVVEVRHPVEVVAADRAHMVQWLTKRLGYDQQVPNLERIGLKLVGGRLLPGPTGVPAALYMYEGPSGERFTLYSARASAPTTALRFQKDDRTAAFYWVDNSAAYVVSGSTDRERLHKVAEAVYEQVDRAPRG